MTGTKWPTVTQMFEETVGQYGDKEALAFIIGEENIKKQYPQDERKKTFNPIGDDRLTITFAELWQLSKVLAQELKERNFQKGDQLILSGRPSIGWAAYTLACFRLGIIILPLDVELGSAEISQIFRTSQARLVAASKEQEDKWLGIGAETILLESWQDFDSLFNRKTFEGEAEIDPDDDLAIIPFTSGTTGRGRGVMLTHSNLTSNVLSLLKVLNINDEDRIFTIAPWYHITGFSCAFLLPIRSGATTLYTPELARIRNIIPAEELTIILSPPKLYNRIIYGRVLKGLKGKAIFRVSPKLVGKKIKQSLLSKSPNFRFFVSGGGKLPSEVGEALTRMGLVVVDGYGLTETSPVITFSKPDEYKGDCIGKPIPDVEVKIEKTKPQDKLGEICTRGPNIMKGYYQDPEATREAIDEEGWFHTGDLGYLENGELFIKGRIKNIIVTEAGKNIYPEEIEPILAKSPYVEEVVVYAGKRRDGEGEIVCAEIFPDWDKDELDEEKREESKRIVWESIRTVQKTLPSFKWVKRINLRDNPFPKTTKMAPKRGDHISE